MKNLNLSLYAIVLVFCANALVAEGRAKAEFAKKMQAIASLDTLVPQAVNPTDSLVFPQIVNGVAGGISIATSVVFSSSELEPFTVTLTLRNSFGNPMIVSLFDSVNGAFLGSQSSFNISMEPFQSRFLETDGDGDIIVGWASVSAPGKRMGGVAAFQLIEEATDEFLTIVGIGASDASIGFFSPVFKSSLLNSNTAFALSNNSGLTAHFQIFLYGNDGSSDLLEDSLGPYQQSAQFVDELFPSMGDPFFGNIFFFRVDSSGELQTSFDIHPVALLLSNGILSSIPVTNIASE